MNIVKKALKKLLMVIAGIAIFITAIAGWGLGILGSVIHIWTIIIAFINKGIIATILTAGFPVLAEIYWFIKIWNLAGTLNRVCL